MTKKITKLTPEQEAMLPHFRDKWLDRCLREGGTDYDAAFEALCRAYELAGVKPPGMYLAVDDPQAGAFLCGAVALEGDPVREAVNAGLHRLVDVTGEERVRISDEVRAQVAELVNDEERQDARWSSAQQGWRCRIWGQYDGWLSYYDAWLEFGIEECARLQGLMDLAQFAGYCWLWEGVCIITARHSRLRRDEEHRLHCEDGPAMQWPGGWSIHAWHGTRIPSEWIEQPGALTAQVAIHWQNAEQRRCACEILGWDEVLKQLDAEVIDEDPDPMVGTLLRVDLPDSPREQFLRVLCGTGRTFAMPVPPELTTALDAQAWAYPVKGLSHEDIKKLIMSREART